MENTVSSTADSKIKFLSPADFAKFIKNPDVVLLDVRTPEEFNAGHIPGAINIDFTSPSFLEKATAILPRDKVIADYCKAGLREAKAADLLARNGYQMVELEGGIDNWMTDPTRPVVQN